MNAEQMVVLAGKDHLEKARQTWGDSFLPVERWPDEIDEGTQLMAQHSHQGRHGFLLFGGDELVGEVVTAYWRRSDLAARPLCFWPLAVEGGLVARACGSTDSTSRAVRMVRRGVDRWRRQQLATLKVTASVEGAAWYGFSFASGWVYRAFEARRHAEGGATNLVSAFGKLASETLGEDQRGPVALRVAVDHRPSENRSGSMVISTLERSYFGLGTAGQGPMVWEGMAASTLMRKAVTPELLESSRRRGRPFEVVHLDTPQGWLLDGRLHESERPGVVQIAPGPMVTFLCPDQGLGAKVRNILSR